MNYEEFINKITIGELKISKMLEYIYIKLEREFYNIHNLDMYKEILRNIILKLKVVEIIIIEIKLLK